MPKFNPPLTEAEVQAAFVGADLRADPVIAGGQGTVLRVERPDGSVGALKIVAFAGTAGLLTLAVGADAWATGWYRGERRLRLADLEQTEGRAMPAYYARPAATEFHLANDLTRVRDAGTLDLARDETDDSQQLLAALDNGLSPSDVAAWRPTQGNVTAARSHYAKAMIRETATLAALAPNEQTSYVRQWLETASATAAVLYQVGSFNPRTELDHQRAWRDAFVAVAG